MSPTRRKPAVDEAQSGFTMLLTLVAAVLPLLLIVLVTTQTMRARQSRAIGETRDERALMAAESGVDQAVYQASTSAGLTSGVDIARDLANGMSFTVTPTFLRSDGVDNDGDGLVDEADENLFRVLVAGRYLDTQRRLVAYLGPESTPVHLPSALTLMAPFSGAELHVAGSASINGQDYLVSGAPSGAASMPGVAIEPPGTVAQLTANIPAGDRARVVGAGASTPSVATAATTTDITATRLAIQNAANLVLTAGSYKNYGFGDASAGKFNVIYKKGNVTFKGNSRGAGVMFITGNLHVEDTFRFDGVIYVLGEVEIHGNAAIYGGVVAGPASAHFYLENTARILYSTEAIDLATSGMPGKYVAFNGWQELSRQ